MLCIFSGQKLMYLMTRCIFIQIHNIFQLPVLEVIQVQRPDHGSTEVQLLDELRLLPDHCPVVIAHPLVTLVGVRAHASALVLLDGPAVVIHTVADLNKYKSA